MCGSNDLLSLIEASQFALDQILSCYLSDGAPLLVVNIDGREAPMLQSGFINKACRNKTKLDEARVAPSVSLCAVLGEDAAALVVPASISEVVLSIELATDSTVGDAAV